EPAAHALTYSPRTACGLGTRGAGTCGNTSVPRGGSGPPIPSALPSTDPGWPSGDAAPAASPIDPSADDPFRATSNAASASNDPVAPSLPTEPGRPLRSEPAANASPSGAAVSAR